MMRRLRVNALARFLFAAFTLLAVAPDSLFAAAEAAAVAAPAAVAAGARTDLAARWPRHGRIVYDLMRGDDGFIIGRSVQSWRHDGREWTLKLETATTGLAALFKSVRIIQESSGVFDAHGLRPLRFDANRNGDDYDVLRFSPQQGVLQADGEQLPWVDGMQDALSLYYQIGLLGVADGEQLVVARNGKTAIYDVQLIGDELLSLANSQRKTRRRRLTAAGRNDVLDVWHDVASHLPLRIRYRDRKGDTYDQLARRIDIGAQSPQP